MGEIRDLLDREADRIQRRWRISPTPSARVHRPRERRERRRRLRAGVLGGVAGAVAIAAATSVLGIGRRPAPHELGPAPSAGMTMRNFSLEEGQNDSLAYGSGSVWVSGFDQEGGRVLKVDPGSGEVVARIAASTTGWERGGGSLASGHGWIWAVGGPSVQRIDPSTGAIQAIGGIDLAPRFGAAIAATEKELWVAVLDPYQPPAPAEVIRLAPSTGEVVSRIPLPEGFGWVRKILPTPGAVWVLAARTDDRTIHDPSLIGLDPISDRIVATRPESFPAATDGESMWASVYLHEEGSWALARLDGGTGEVLETIPIGTERVELLATGDGVWFVTEGNVVVDGNVVNVTDGPRYRLGHLDPTTGKVEIIAEGASGGGVIDVAPSPGSVWLLHRDGTLTRIDLP